MQSDWLTTGETANFLGVSRQHVVDLCERGELSCTRVGTHRRILRSDIQALVEPALTREQEKSLWLHRAILGQLMLDPETVVEHARRNIATWLPEHRKDGMSVRYLHSWQDIVDDGIEAVVTVLTGTDERSRELRQNSPFAGVLTDDERRQVLRSFRAHWDQKHSAA